MGLKIVSTGKQSNNTHVEVGLGLAKPDQKKNADTSFALADEPLQAAA